MIPDRLFDDLCEGAREAVWDAFEWAHGFSAFPLPEEVEHLHAMVTTGTRTLMAHWAPVLRSAGIALRLTGVFIHQTPKAHYHHPHNGRVGPELGDLLVVHDHRANGQTFRKAVLVQLKRCVAGVPGTPDPIQEHLYRSWPDFELVGLGRRGSGTRFLPGDRNLRANLGGSRYGLIADDLDPHDRCSGCWSKHAYKMPWTFVDPAGPVRTAGGEDAGSFIANMLFSSPYPRGREAALLAGTLALSPPWMANNHFDVTIEELLRLTAEKTMTYRRYGIAGEDRGVSVSCLQLADGLSALLPESGTAFRPTDDGEGGDHDIVEGPEEPEEGGMSILLIETGGEV